jgi:hypothetical protein
MLALAMTEVECGAVIMPGPFATSSKTPPFIGLEKVPSEKELVPSEFFACRDPKGVVCDKRLEIKEIVELVNLTRRMRSAGTHAQI